MSENTIPHTDKTQWVSSTDSKLYSLKNMGRYSQLIGNLSHRKAWLLDNEKLKALYNENVSSRHLEVGPANAEMLSNTTPPASPDEWRIHLMDINHNPLVFAKEVLSDRAIVEPVQHDVLVAPWPNLSRAFDSIAMGNVLHCLPGNGFPGKDGAFAGIADALTDDGVAWGYTVLGLEDPDVEHNFLARTLIRAYNKPDRKFFQNAGDRLADLEPQLRQHFDDVTVWSMGSAALFIVKKPKR